MHTEKVYEQLFAVSVLEPDGEVSEVIYVSALCRESAEGFVRAMGKGEFGFSTVVTDGYDAVTMHREIHRVICADRIEQTDQDMDNDSHPPLFS